MRSQTEVEVTDLFPTDATGLPAARRTEVVELADGAAFDLRIAPVSKRLGDATVRMLAYNGSIPGPTLKVREGTEVVVNMDNQGDLEATVHWHGLRLENRYDGTHETQQPMAVGETFSARVAFPDPGVYWYHPHIREDYGQEMGLYGNVLVEPADPDYWPPAHRELLLTLDDILIGDGKVAPFSRTETTYAAMGRFGDVLLISGEPELSLTAQRGEVVRVYLTNTANTRVFKVALPGARMKLVGGDSGHVEHEQFVEDVVLAPSERIVVDATCAATASADRPSRPRILLEALKREGIDHATVLDVGGGIGAIQQDLLDAGAERATSVEASAAYLRAAREEADRRGHTDRISYLAGDFVALADRVELADVVTLDRVICCYPDMEALVSRSADRALRLYGPAYPPDSWWVRFGFRCMNLVMRVARRAFRVDLHRTYAVDAVAREHGLTPRLTRRAGPVWQVAAYGRDAR